MARDTRQWNDYRAHIKITEGDPAECHKWYGIALNRLKFLLAHRPGSVTDAMAPSDGVYIRVDTKPNRIYIKVEGGVFPTVMNPTGTPSAYPSGTVPPYQLYKERRVYKGLNYQIVNGLYAGGPFNVYAPYPTGTVKGGSWHNGKNKALSWHGTGNCTFYIGDRWSTITAPTANHYAAAACVVGDSIRQTIMDNTPAGFPYILLVVFTDSSSLITLRAYTVLKNGSLLDRCSFTQFFSATYPNAFQNVLGFNDNGTAFYTFERGSASQADANYLRTIIKRHALQPAPASVSIVTATIYSELERGLYGDTLTSSELPLTTFARVEGDSVNLFGTFTTAYTASAESTDTSYIGEYSTQFNASFRNVNVDGLVTNIPAGTATNRGSNLVYSATDTGFEMTNTSDGGSLVLVDFSFKFKCTLILSYEYTLNQSQGGSAADEFESYTDNASETVTLTSYTDGIQVQAMTLYSDSSVSTGTRPYSDPGYGGTTPPEPDTDYHRVNLATQIGDAAIANTVTLAVYGENLFTGPIGGVFWTITFNRKTGAFSAIQEPDIRRVTGHPFSSQVGLTHLKF